MEEIGKKKEILIKLSVFEEVDGAAVMTQKDFNSVKEAQQFLDQAKWK